MGVFLLHCLLSDSPPDTPEEIEALKHNQQLAAERGREPGLRLQRGDEEVLLTEWAHDILQQCQGIAQALDATHNTDAYTLALQAAQDLLEHPELTPSARVLQATQAHGNSFKEFGLCQSRVAYKHVLSQPFSKALQAKFEQLSSASVLAQQEMEASDSDSSFEEWRQRYMDPANLL